MVVAPVLWSTAGVVTRHLQKAPAFEQVFWRSLFCFAFVSAFLLFRKSSFSKAFEKPALFSGAMWAVMFTAFVFALSMTSTANTLVVMSVSPVLTTLAAWIVLKEPVPARTAIAAVAAGAGIAWMAAGDMDALSARDVTGMLFALLVPLAAAANFVTLRSVARRSEGLRVDLVPAVMTGALFSFLVALPFAMPFQATGRDIALLAFLGFFQLGVPCMLMVVAARVLRPPELALLALLEVVLGVLWTWLWAGETPSAATLSGGAMVLGALIFNEIAGFRGTMRSKLSATRISG
ncbi:MAG TPA: DMT family transporter [Burkholderiales bacterium]|jgi:drug/metabolite transporter (DMT)-like permease|nr:DMT family transporter [Burkholderiales bacterium]